MARPDLQTTALLRAILADCGGNVKVAATQARMTVARFNSFLKEPKPMKTSIGPRKREKLAAQDRSKRAARGKKCAVNGCFNIPGVDTSVVVSEHNVPVSIRPDLQDDPENILDPSCGCSDLDRAPSVKVRWLWTLMRYGRKALMYAQANWPPRAMGVTDD